MLSFCFAKTKHIKKSTRSQHLRAKPMLIAWKVCYNLKSKFLLTVCFTKCTKTQFSYGCKNAFLLQLIFDRIVLRAMATGHDATSNCCRRCVQSTIVAKMHFCNHRKTKSCFLCYILCYKMQVEERVQRKFHSKLLQSKSQVS